MTDDQPLTGRSWRYPAGVRLVRKAENGPGVAPESESVESLETWLLTEAAAETDLMYMIEQFVWRVTAAGLPLERLTVHAGTLHPNLIGFTWTWRHADGAVEETQVGPAARDSDSFLKNPMYVVMVEGREVSAYPERDRDRWPIMEDLLELGITHYLAFPFGAGFDQKSSMTLATKQPGGFTDAQEASLRRLTRVLALHVERQLQLRVATTLLDTYLGGAARRRVLEGAIQRGDGERLPAVVWMSDLRGFTAMSGRLGPRQLLDVLDAAFEAAAGAVLAEGGEVLKFLGDGVLAVFEIDPEDEGRAAAEAALRAAQGAQKALADLNENPPEHLAELEGWRPLRAGVAVHAGDVFFGNIGAPERLDFTVIGPAVNAASRVEGLCKALSEPVLVTEPIVKLLGGAAMRALGKHDLRGVAEPLGVYAPGSWKADAPAPTT